MEEQTEFEKRMQEMEKMDGNPLEDMLGKDKAIHMNDLLNPPKDPFDAEYDEFKEDEEQYIITICNMELVDLMDYLKKHLLEDFKVSLANKTFRVSYCLSDIIKCDTISKMNNLEKLSRAIKGEIKISMSLDTEVELGSSYFSLNKRDIILNITFTKYKPSPKEEPEKEIEVKPIPKTPWWKAWKREK